MCIKYALHIGFSDEVNPGKCHYLLLICFIKSVLITEGDTEMKQEDFLRLRPLCKKQEASC